MPEPEDTSPPIGRAHRRDRWVRYAFLPGEWLARRGTLGRKLFVLAGFAVIWAVPFPLAVFRQISGGRDALQAKEVTVACGSRLLDLLRGASEARRAGFVGEPFPSGILAARERAAAAECVDVARTTRAGSNSLAVIGVGVERAIGDVTGWNEALRSLRVLMASTAEETDLLVGDPPREVRLGSLLFRDLPLLIDERGRLELEAATWTTTPTNEARADRGLLSEAIASAGRSLGDLTAAGEAHYVAGLPESVGALAGQLSTLDPQALTTASASDLLAVLPTGADIEGLGAALSDAFLRQIDGEVTALAARSDAMRNRLMLGGVLLLYLGMCWRRRTQNDATGLLTALGQDGGKRRQGARPGDEMVRIDRAVRVAVGRYQDERDRLLFEAQHDSLTGLPNRVAAVRYLHRAIQRQQPSRVLAVLFIDLNNFKLVNDSFGHRAGDHLLQVVAGRLKESARSADLVTRLGGDEFAVVCEDLVSAEAAVAFANRTLARLLEPIELPGDQGMVQDGASIGLALRTPDQPLSADQLLECADVAMYAAKQQGAGRVHLFDTELRREARRRLELRSELRQALADPDHSGLFTHFQPVIGASLGELLGFECLARWWHPRFGFVQPSEFVPLAEHAGLIDSLGRFVLNEAATHVARWRQQRPDLYVTINLSPFQLTTRTVLRDLREALDANALPGEAICVELTESGFLRNPDQAMDLLLDIQNMGVRLVIDDFGAGFSSLGYLHQLRPWALKIDRSFVVDLDGPDGDTCRRIISAVVTLAHGLGLSVIAEGVETPAQLGAVQELCCDALQGYLTGKPIDASDADVYVTHSLMTSQGSPTAR